MEAPSYVSLSCQLLVRDRSRFGVGEAGREPAPGFVTDSGQAESGGGCRHGDGLLVRAGGFGRKAIAVSRARQGNTPAPMTPATFSPAAKESPAEVSIWPPCRVGRWWATATAFATGSWRAPHRGRGNPCRDGVGDAVAVDGGCDGPEHGHAEHGPEIVAGLGEGRGGAGPVRWDGPDDHADAEREQRSDEEVHDGQADHDRNEAVRGMRLGDQHEAERRDHQPAADRCALPYPPRDGGREHRPGRDGQPGRCQQQRRLRGRRPGNRGCCTCYFGWRCGVSCSARYTAGSAF